MKHVPATRLILMLGSAFALGACGGAVDDPDFGTTGQAVKSDPKLDEFQAHPPHKVHGAATLSPTGLSPDQIRAVYNLPAGGGTGTIAIVDAYDDPTAESDLGVFSSRFGLPACATANGCFQKVKMSNHVKADPGWALEIALDVEWAHAIAPDAKILLVEANSASGTDLLAAVDYASARADVVAISMSWGGAEFSTEAASDGRFTSAYGAAFFAASGDNGTGTMWPAVSPNIIAVGGTTLTFDAGGNLAGETAWSGSGGGVSLYESIPDYQATFGITGSKRRIPDVSYDANPSSGFSVYDSTRYQGQKGWFKVGGTSAGAPQWAAIQALGHSSSNANCYADAAPDAAIRFRDIVSGTNGTCGAVCTASAGYDTVTGLGSPLTTAF